MQNNLFVQLCNYLNIYVYLVSEAFVTLATNDDYALGALTLAMSLKQTDTTKKLAIMITDSVTTSMKYEFSYKFKLCCNNAIISEALCLMFLTMWNL